MLCHSPKRDKMKQAKGEVSYMEEKKDYFENTEEQMIGNSTQEEQVPETKAENVSSPETMAENRGQEAHEDSRQEHQSIPQEFPVRGNTVNREENTSYSYGERVSDGMPYQSRTEQFKEEWDTTPLTMGDWLLTLLAAFIPCCGGIILYCYWAFARKGNLHRRNFCRAALIVEAVLIVLLIVFLVLVVIIGSVSYSSGTSIGGSYYYGY